MSIQRLAKSAHCAALLAGAATFTFMTVPVHAQQQIQWQQTFKPAPKGANLPPDIKADILGIELGDTLAEVRAKLERLSAEAPPDAGAQPPKPSGFPSVRDLEKQAEAKEREQAAIPIKEINTEFQFHVASTMLTATYVGALVLNRKLPGSGPQKIEEMVSVQFSAPSSGQQAIGIKRVLNYINRADQPRISETVARLQEKLHAQPQAFFGTLFRFQYSEGRLISPPGSNSATCVAHYSENSPQGAANANSTGNCSVLFELSAGRGISEDHASVLTFILSDNERTRQNVGADFQYFQNYARGLQATSKGVAPKL